jgi:hypothetical protein
VLINDDSITIPRIHDVPHHVYVSRLMIPLKAGFAEAAAHYTPWRQSGTSAQQTVITKSQSI